jgi:hypothetical protein
LKHLSRIRPSALIAFTALFVAMSGIAVADNDGKVKGNKVNVKKGAINGNELAGQSVGFGKLKSSVRNAIEDGGGTGGPGPAGPPGSGGGGGAGSASTKSFNYRVDGPSSNQTILTGNGFLLRASCAVGDPAIFIDSTADNNAYSQVGLDTNNAPVNGAENEDFDIADADEALDPDADDDVVNTLNVRPLTGAVTTVNYTIDTGEQGFDCNITGTATTQG